jgi:type II secretory pathway pseudopilin PulG
MRKHALKQGFTIMETLVAISLLLLAITGPMVFAQNGLRAAFQSRDQVTAFYLAQDAIEFIKNRRDHNILEKESGEWLSSFDGTNSGPNCASGANREGGCTFDTSLFNGRIEMCSFDTPATGCLGRDPEGTEDVPLKIDDKGVIGFGKDSSSKNSIFSRTVYVDKTVEDEEARVTVIVRWRSHENLGVREIEMVEYVRNWASALDI